MGKEIRTDMFFWDKKEGRFSQEASSLNIPAGIYYEDITLINPKTKGACRFVLVDAERTREGEIECWEYKTNELFHGKCLTLTIWND